MNREPIRWQRRIPLEFRWRCGLRSGNWRASHAEAGEAAVRAGLASWEGKTLFLGPLVEIETRRARDTKKAGQA